MQIELQIRKVVKEAKLQHHGVIKEIAAYADAHRHTITKLFANTHPAPPLELLSKVCNWLIDNGVKAQTLPAALFGSQSDGLWPAAGKAGIVSIYLGEFQQFQDNAHIPWVSKQDTAVLNALIKLLSTDGVCGDAHPKLSPEYVPFRVDESKQASNREEVRAEHAAAVSTYRKICRNLEHSSAILIGSQRINRLVEAFVADLFDCKPFVAESHPRVPFYLAYQSRIRPVESCFGGLQNPPGRRGRFIPGIHYLNSSRKWECIEWIEHKQDSGVVITSHDAGKLMLAVFGLRGRATEVLGKFVIENPNKFWPAKTEKPGAKRRVYICKITYPPRGSIKPGDPDRAEKVEVIPLDASILTQYLKEKPATANPAKAAPKPLKTIVKHSSPPGAGSANSVT